MIPNRMSKFIVSKKTNLWTTVRRSRTIEHLKNLILERIGGYGKKSIGIYVKIAEIPDNIEFNEVYALINQIKKDYEKVKQVSKQTKGNS